MFSQVSALAYKDFLQSFRDRTFVILGCLLAALFLLSCWVGASAHHRSQGDMANLQALVDQQWIDQPDRHPHRVAHYGTFAFRPQTSLGFLDFGVRDYTGSAIFLEAHQQNSANFSEARQESSLLRFGILTPAFILQVLLPLLIVFVLSRSVVRERESGTLAMLVVSGTSNGALLLGKMASGVLVFATLLLPVTALAVAAIASLTEGMISLSDLNRLALLAAAYALYLTVWIGVVVLISSLSRKTSSAIVTSLLVWIVLVILIPKALPSLGHHWYPAPSRPEFEQALHLEVVQGGHGHDPGSAKFEQLKQELLDEHQVDSVEELPVNFRGVVMQAGEDQSSRVYREHYNRLQDCYRQQNTLMEKAALFNPYLAIRLLSSALCGTDLEHAIDFEEQAEDYRFEVISRLNDLHTHHVSYQNDKEIRLEASFWRGFPPFDYRAPEVQEALKPATLAVPALLLQLLLLFGFLWKTKVEPR